MRQVKAAAEQGKLPTTDQLVRSIEELQNSGSLQSASEGLSVTGKKVLLDTEKFVEDARTALRRKMPENELQNVIYYGSLAGQRAQPDVPIDAQNAAQQLMDAGARAADLAKMIVTSAEFRTLLKDISSIVQEVLRSNIEEASDEVASDPNVPESVRNAAAKTRHEVRHNDLQGAAANLTDEARGKAEEVKDRASSEVQGRKGEAQQRGYEAKYRAEDTAEATKDTAGEAVSQGASLRDTAKAVVDVVADKAEEHLPADAVNQFSETTRENAARLYQGETSTGDISANISQQARDAANDIAAKAKQQLAQTKEQLAPLKDTGRRVAEKLANMPPEKRDEVIRRVREVTRTLQSKPEFRRAFEDVLSLLRDVGTKVAVATDSAVQTIADAPTDPRDAPVSKESQLASLNAKKLIENFASGKSLDPLINSIKDFADQARSDDELQILWSDVAAFLERSFQEGSQIDNDQYKQEALKLIDRSQDALQKYDYYTQRISYEGSNFADALASDRDLRRLSADSQMLLSDLFLDERGQPTFKPELLADLAKCIPAIADKLAYLPVPRIETDDGTYHMILDNIILHTTILPKYIHLVTDTTIDATKEETNDQLKNKIVLEISNVTASARDVAWLLYKHTGLIKAGDVGLADFDITSPGLTVKVVLSPTPTATAGGPDQARILHIDQITTTLNNLSLRLHDSHHDILYKLLKPVIQAKAKKGIEDAVKNTLKDGIFKLDAQMASAAEGPQGPEPVKGLPEWGSKAYDPK